MDRLAVPASAEGHARGVRQNERAKVGRAVRHAVGAGPRTCASRILNSLAASRIETPLRGAWRLASSNEVRSHASLKGHTPSTFVGGHMAARAELNNVRWVSHCRDLVQLPVAA